MKPSPPQNGIVKESLIPEETTTNVDVEHGVSPKTMLSNGNATLRIGFVHQEETDTTAAPVVGLPLHPAGNFAQPHMSSPSNGAQYARHSKPVEWRLHLGHVKVRSFLFSDVVRYYVGR